MKINILRQTDLETLSQTEKDLGALLDMLKIQNEVVKGLIKNNLFLASLLVDFQQKSIEQLIIISNAIDKIRKLYKEVLEAIEIEGGDKNEGGNS